MKTFTLFHLVLAATLFSACGTLAQASPPISSPPTTTKNIPYVANGTARQNFDLYLPARENGQPVPLIVWIHGGAWSAGSKDWDNVGYLVKHGYAIASIDYRFSQEAKFPAQIQDCNAALNFIIAHAGEYDIDSSRFVVAGGSAGGHLALLLGLARNEKDFGADPSLKPLAILDFFGPADFNTMMDDLTAMHDDAGIKLFKDAVGQLLGVPVDQPSDKAKIASPINYVTAASAPVLILHGGKDESVPNAQSQHLHVALDKAGVKNQLIIVAAAGHDGPLFSTPDIQAKVIDFLKVYMPPTE